MAQMGNNLPAMQEIWVQSLGEEDPLKKGMATHSNILAWRVPWTEEPSSIQSTEWGHKESDMSEHSYTHTHTLKQCHLHTEIVLARHQKEQDT